MIRKWEERMLRKLHLFTVVVAANFFLLACSTNTEGQATANDHQPVTEAEDAEAKDDDNGATETTEDSDSEAAEQESEATEDSDSEDSESKTEPAKEEKNKIEENSDLAQLALNALVSETGLKKEDYSFILTGAKDYIEIEVRQKSDDNEDKEYMPLEGVYRYIFATKEIQIRDYLTGSFMQFED